MAVLMTIAAKGFQVGRMVRAILGQFENVVAMTVDIFGRFTASLTDAIIAGVNVLLEWYPQVYRWTPIPGEPQTGDFSYCESYHTLPFLAMPCPTKPDPDRPCHTAPSQTLPDPALATKNILTIPDLTTTRLTISHRAWPYRVVPYPCHKGYL